MSNEKLDKLFQEEVNARVKESLTALHKELARDILSSYDRLPPVRFREYLEDKIKQYRGC